MLEAIVVIGLFVALVLAGGRSSRPIQAPTIHLSDTTDLPCPWCRAATNEYDDYCASCGQPFGTSTQTSTRSTPNPSDW
jgi:predicted amidophosphoribosyltransferase